MPPLRNGAPWRVTNMTLIGERLMGVEFVDGTKGTVRFSPNFFRGVFAHLKDTARFAEATLEMGAVTWPGELDLAPDRMHRDIQKHGECVIG